MSIIDAIQSFFSTILRKIVEVSQRLVADQILVDEQGTITIRSSVVQSMANKAGAFIIASAALTFLTMPSANPKSMQIGDMLMRAATRLWDGTDEHGSGLPATG